MSFQRGLEVKQAMKIGDKHTRQIDGIALVLKNMYNQYKETGVISGLSTYENEWFTRNHSKKLIDMGILKRATISRRNMQYIWIGDDNPDFVKLAKDVLAFSKKDKSEGITGPVLNSIVHSSSDITKILLKYDVLSDNIGDITQEIIQLFYKKQ
ncbi:MAG: hypothetical protein LLG13_12860 [Bacteroidales bacterium]|nr:hypothetical protein [Bacteroidales bacterium]